MGGAVRRRPKVALDDAAVAERHDDDVVWPDPLARDAARLDQEDAGITIHAADVAEREGDEPGARDFAIGPSHRFAKLVEGWHDVSIRLP